MNQPWGLLGLHPPVLLPPGLLGVLRHLDDATDVSDGLALGDQLLGGLEIAHDLLRCALGAFHGEVPDSAGPDEGSHSPWPESRGLLFSPCHPR